MKLVRTFKLCNKRHVEKKDLPENRLSNMILEFY